MNLLENEYTLPSLTEIDFSKILQKVLLQKNYNNMHSQLSGITWIETPAFPFTYQITWSSLLIFSDFYFGQVQDYSS